MGTLGLAGFQIKLLENIKELTLYTISQENRLKNLRAQNREFQSQMNELIALK